jgi:major membrane immunogen (membrane-anchored lipoprotein)
MTAFTLTQRLMLVAAMLLVGCGRSGPPRVATHPTKGSITFQGQPVSGAFVALHPKQSSHPEVPTSTAIVQPNGTFAVSTYDSGDGVPEGEYVVTVQWRKVVKSGSDFVPGPSLLPAKYSRPETSDVTVRVAAGNNALAPIALKR